MQLASAVSVTDQHLDPRDVAAYIDHAASPAERARIEVHLATCADCRAEVSDAARIVSSLPRSRRVNRSLIASAGAIAAVLLVFMWPRAHRDDVARQHRESAITTTVSPVILAPVGVVESAKVFTWSSVPHASRYDVQVFDAEGSVVWRRETPDTVVTAPSTIALRAGQPYYWKVEALTGFERSTSTELVGFSIRGQRE